MLEAHGVGFDQLSEQERAEVMNALQMMARDARGNPTAATPPNPEGSLNPSSTGASNKKANSKVERVTRMVKGQKEIVIEIAALQSKGYPAPVNLNTGGAQNREASASSTRANGRR